MIVCVGPYTMEVYVATIVLAGPSEVAVTVWEPAVYVTIAMLPLIVLVAVMYSD